MVRIACLFFVAAVVSLSASAAVKMPRIFGDNMVLQQQKPVAVWGTALPNASVEVVFGEDSAKTKAGPDGKWKVFLPAQKASFFPRTLSVSENGAVGAEFGNVLVGEVWITGGQSNMEWYIKNTDAFERALSDARNYKIRQFTQVILASDSVRDDVVDRKARWIESLDKSNAGKWAAVSYYFAEEIAKAMNVPVGILYTPVGGASMMPFTPGDVLADSKGYFKKRYEEFLERSKGDTHEKSVARWRKARAEFEAKQKADEAAGKKPAVMPHYLRAAPWRGVPFPFYWRSTPTLLYNGSVLPILPYSTRGIIWYQGCADSSAEAAEVFDDMLEKMAGAWRRDSGEADKPFLIVQLASFSTDHKFAEVREAQFKAANKMKNSGVINIADTGEQWDIHPRDKDIVGSRLGKLALQKVYKKPGVFAQSPEMKTVLFNGPKAEVKFETFGRGLEARGDVRGFEVLAGGKWLPASAKLNGETVVVENPDGAEIRGVRYLWHSWVRPDVCLFNKDGLPAFPFLKTK